MNEKAFTILTMKNGLTMRLSYTVYEAFKKHMLHKEKAMKAKEVLALLLEDNLQIAF